MSDTEHLAKENKQLQVAINELKVINDIATAISSTQPVEEVIEQIVSKCIKHLGVEEGTVSLLEQNSADQQFHTMVRRHSSSGEKVPIKLDDRLKGWMLKNRSVLLINNFTEDQRFNFPDKQSYPIRSILCVPLMVKGNLIGYLAVFNKKDEQPFTDEDRRLLSIIGSQSAQVIENARLYEEERALLSLQEEMRMARDIQLNLLPDKPPQISGFQIAAVNKPAKSVGGDYYDFLSLNSNRLALCIGDITGKGMPAAMLMANLQATFRSQVLNAEDCANCIKGTNKLLYKSTEPTKFATLFYGVLNPDTNTLEYANAGHDAPLLFRNGHDPVSLNSTGLLLGVMEETDYTNASVEFKPGEVLLLYTDGITEAMNPNGDEFGLDRLITTVNASREKTAEEIMESILDEIKNHAAKASQSDDITLMILKKED